MEFKVLAEFPKLDATLLENKDVDVVKDEIVAQNGDKLGELYQDLDPGLEILSSAI